MENLLHCENVLDCRKFLDFGKLTFWIAEKIIGLIIVKTNVNIDIS